MPSNPKDVLTQGAVKPWHVIFIVLVAYVVGGVAADKLLRVFDSGLRPYVRDGLSVSIAAVIMIAYTLVVPEFRRVLPILFRRARVPVTRTDAGWAFAVALCWGYGLYRAGFCLPALQLKPEWFSVVGLNEAMPDFQFRYLLLLAGPVLLAPLAEELVFRGFLLNLWIARWGVWPAIIASSLFFGAMHWERTLFAGVMGVGFALVYLKYDSLWPGIALHAAYNLLTFYWLLGGLFSIKDRATVQDPSNWIPEIALAILFFPFAWLFWRRFRPGRPAG